MSNFEFNKVFAAVLCALLVIWIGGFAAERIVSPRALEKNAVEIEGASDEHGGGEAAVSSPTGPEPIMALIAAADAEKGAKLSKACAACHSFGKGEPAKQGPNLWGVIGKAKASSDFPPGYSDGMKAKGGKWDYDALNHFFWKPKAYVDGTKMNFIGLKKAEDRAALVAWLRTQADSPAALPTDTEIAAEAAALAPPVPVTVDPMEDAKDAKDAAPTDATAPAETKKEDVKAAEHAEEKKH